MGCNGLNGPSIPNHSIYDSLCFYLIQRDRFWSYSLDKNKATTILSEAVPENALLKKIKLRKLLMKTAAMKLSFHPIAGP